MKSKRLQTCLSILVGAIIVVLIFLAGAGVGYFAPRLFPSDIPVSGPVQCPPCIDTESGFQPECPECPYLDPSGSTPADAEALFAPFWETWEIVHERFVDQPVDDLALMRGAIEGMLASLGDKHTSYMSPEEFEQANESLEGEYEGIGAWVDITGEFVEIVSPMNGSPADQAGLKPKDKVIAIDGKDMAGIPGDLVLQHILGPAGSEVILTIQRGEEIFDVTIIRGNIVVPTVEYEMLADNIGYVALQTYGDNSTQQLRDALKDLKSQNAKGIIFDLRNNGGGYLNTAIEVVSEFIGEGIVMYEQYGDGETFTYEAIPGGAATEIPLVVLVNEGTASASEITAGAIQDLSRAPLVGVVTYGKGSVQSWIALEDNAGGVRVTIARWLTPDGRQISDKGLTPEYIVEMTEEDYDAERDPQLDKALEVILNMVR